MDGSRKTKNTLEWSGSDLLLKPFTRIGIEVQTYQNLKNYMKNHANDIRKYYGLNEDKAITYSHTIDYALGHNTTK